MRTCRHTDAPFVHNVVDDRLIDGAGCPNARNMDDACRWCGPGLLCAYAAERGKGDLVSPRLRCRCPRAVILVAVGRCSRTAVHHTRQQRTGRTNMFKTANTVWQSTDVTPCQRIGANSIAKCSHCVSLILRGQYYSTLRQPRTVDTQTRAQGERWRI